MTTRAGWVARAVLVPPSEIGLAIGRLFLDPEFQLHLGRTLFEIGASFGLAVALGVPIGALFWHFERVGEVLEPFLDALYAVPLLLFYPLTLVYFGIGPWGIVLIGFVMSIVPIIINTRLGLSEIRERYWKLGRIHRMTWLQQLSKITLPAAAPYLFAGLRLGFIYALIGVIAMEFILTDIGIGYAVNFHYNFFKTQQMYAYIAVIILLSTLFYLLAAWLERQLLAEQTVVLRSVASRREDTPRQIGLGRIATLLVIWLGWMLAAQTETVASPLASGRVLVNMLQSGTLWPHVWATFWPVTLGFVLAAVSGIAIGAFLGSNRFWRAVFDPFILIAYGIPKITIFPIIILFVGLNLSARVWMAYIHAVFPIIIITIAGVRDLNPVFLRLARANSATPRQTLFKVFLPAIRPAVFSAFQIGFSLATIGVVLSEFFAAQQGLGFLILNAYSAFQLDVMFGVVLLLYALALLFNWGLQRARNE